jgi:site-specific DNA-adenine methylase
MKPAFPYYGSKTKIAKLIWDYFGDLKVFVEPFCGSAAMLFGRPNPKGRELINDMNGFVVNFFRAVKAEPDKVAEACHFPVNECELHARHVWLMEQDIQDQLYNDPDFYDVTIAGRWLYGARIWIGAGWCKSKNEQIPELRKNNERRPDIQHESCPNQVPYLAAKCDNRTLDQRADFPLNTVCDLDIIKGHMNLICERLKFVKVICGDWKRVVTNCVLNPAIKDKKKVGIFFDPPYAHQARMKKIYAHDSLTIAKEVEEWCKDHPQYKIVLAGYEGDYDLPGECIEWKSSSNHSNAYKERLWLL